MKRKLEQILELHKVMSKAFFYRVDTNIKEVYEKSHSCITDFEFQDNQYTIIQQTKVNEDGYVKYTVKYLINGIEQKSDIRLIKRILNQL